MIPFTRSGQQPKAPASASAAEPEKAKSWLHSPPPAREGGGREKKLDQGVREGLKRSQKRLRSSVQQCNHSSHPLLPTPLFASTPTQCARQCSESTLRYIGGAVHPPSLQCENQSRLLVRQAWDMCKAMYSQDLRSSAPTFSALWEPIQLGWWAGLRYYADQINPGPMPSVLSFCRPVSTSGQSWACVLL